MKIILDLDDYSVLRNRWDLMLQLKEHYPKLKLSLFTIPYDYEYEGVHQFRIMREEKLNLLKENLDWIQIIPHGVTHMPREFEKADRVAVKLALKAIDDAFTKDGIPYVKGFKAPFWLWNQDVCDVLDQAGWFGATDRNQPEMKATKKNYVYNWDIKDPFPKNVDVVKGHGHMTPPSANNLEQCFTNLLKMPTDAEFGFVTDEL